MRHTGGSETERAAAWDRPGTHGRSLSPHGRSLREVRTSRLSLLLLLTIGFSTSLAAITEAGRTPAIEPAPSGAGHKETGGVAARASAHTFTDEWGREVTVPDQPQRVLAPYLEDPLIVLGIQPIAQWQSSITGFVNDYLQPWLKDVPGIVTSGAGPQPEAVLSYNPDLILFPYSVWVQSGLYDTYAKIAPTYVFDDALRDWRETLLTLGEIFGKTDVAKQAIRDYEEKAREARLKVDDAIGDATVAVIWALNSKSLYLLGTNADGGQAQAVLYEDLGLTPPDLARGQDLPQISLEKLWDLHADHIFLAIDESGVGWKELTESPIWQSLPAVQQGHVYEVDYSIWMTNGPVANELTIETVLDALVGEQR